MVLLPFGKSEAQTDDPFALFTASVATHELAPAELIRLMRLNTLQASPAEVMVGMNDLAQLKSGQTITLSLPDCGLTRLVLKDAKAFSNGDFSLVAAGEIAGKSDVGNPCQDIDLVLSKRGQYVVEARLNYQLRDVLGRQVSVEIESGTEVDRILLSGTPAAGMYFLTIRDEAGQSIVIPVTKQ